ncbi:hypothetical protein BX616_003924 [Lobosporangium transversale]|nr:hypothetical protein BX616_003924 [Lobosporangium transversale]
MCGILFGIQRTKDVSSLEYSRTWSTLQELNARRGPSAQDTHSVKIDQDYTQCGDVGSGKEMTFYGAVLHLRGDRVTRQPHVSKTGNILLWNGEIFDGIFVDHHENDGEVLMTKLEAFSQTDNVQSHTNRILQVMASIEGPYAFVYFHALTRTIHFGRDCLGRRSLLWHKRNNEGSNIDLPFILTSVGYSSFRKDLMLMEEVPADGIYRLALEAQSKMSLTRYPWASATSIQPIPNEPLPFGKVNDHIPTVNELAEPFPKDIKFDQAHPEVVPFVTEDMRRAISDMIEILGDSVRRRVQDIPRTGQLHEARVGILFSGGLDCLCLAALADRFLPQDEAIDLLNVGFENPRTVRAQAAEEALALKRLKKLSTSVSNTGESKTNSPITQPRSKYNVPDRVTGYESLAELRRIAPNRHWNFVEVNVPFDEATAHRGEILERIAPLETVMDLSIAMAFWFASRGIGFIKDEEGELMSYTSQAKVLLSGLGADEQLGGYSRHKEQFSQSGWEGLIQELQLDLDRISTRNLGRDDRIISDHGKEARYPFLCTNVVQFLSSLRVDLKVFFLYPRGVGEKILLRHVARELGFKRASSHWKRAVQFGARTAKMTESGRAEIGQQIVDRGSE